MQGSLAHVQRAAVSRHEVPPPGLGMAKKGHGDRQPLVATLKQQIGTPLT